MITCKGYINIFRFFTQRNIFLIKHSLWLIGIGKHNKSHKWVSYWHTSALGLLCCFGDRLCLYQLQYLTSCSISFTRLSKYQWTDVQRSKVSFSWLRSSHTKSLDLTWSSIIECLFLVFHHTGANKATLLEIIWGNQNTSCYWTQIKFS